jgi:hypothetical protein
MSRSVRLNGHLDLGKAYYKIYFATPLDRVAPTCYSIVSHTLQLQIH